MFHYEDHPLWVTDLEPREETWHDLPDPRRDPWTGRIRPVFIDENPDDEWEF